MARTFAYGRVSTAEQNADNQLLALKQRGFEIESHRWFSESISGGTPALKRPQFAKLIDRLEKGDTLVVLKLDRLGRDVNDVLATVDSLASNGVHVRTLDLDGVDLASAAGRLQLTVLGAVAEFERGRIKERTREGLARSGKKPGRPIAVATTRQVQACKDKGFTQLQTSTTLRISLATVKRHWNLIR